jgi:tight adherence protein B
MSTTLIVILMAILGSAAVAGLYYRANFSGAAAEGPSNRRSLRDLSEQLRQLEPEDEGDDLLAQSQDLQLEAKDDDEPEVQRRLTLAMRLKYARLEGVPPYVISIAQVVISLVAFLLARAYLKEVLQVVSLFVGPMVVNWWINRRIKKRVVKFEADFSQFLLSVVGMLKTGLNSVQALQSAADSLEEESLVRQEVELMLERFRVGVPEDRSIGSFGEDVMQPEIELFVQALLLSKRVGGNLSDSLERLAKQTRKRQNFKSQAQAGVSMQRSSLYLIIAIIMGMQGYLYLVNPVMVTGAWTHPSLAGVAQAVLVLIFLAVFWLRKMTNIKV